MTTVQHDQADGRGDQRHGDQDHGDQVPGNALLTIHQTEVARAARRMERAADQDAFWPASGFGPLVSAKTLWKAGASGRIRWKPKPGDRKKQRHLYAVRDVRSEWPHLWD